MQKSEIQSQLENFVCMLTQDYNSLDRDIQIPTIKRLLTLINKRFFAKAEIVTWADVRTYLYYFYSEQGLDLNAEEDILAEEIEAGDQKSLMESLIILCWLVLNFNRKVYEETQNYFLSKRSLSPNEDFFSVIAGLGNDIELELERRKIEKRKFQESYHGGSTETQNLLDQITQRNLTIQKLKDAEQRRIAEIEKLKKENEELKTRIKKHNGEKEDLNHELAKQESIYQAKLNAMEEDFNKAESEHRGKVKKMITNFDIERNQYKKEARIWAEERGALKKEISKLKNEKLLIEKTLELKEIDISRYTKENKKFKEQANKLEIKYKSSLNWKERHAALKEEMERLKEWAEKLEKKVLESDPEYVNKKDGKFKRLDSRHDSTLGETNPPPSNDQDPANYGKQPSFKVSHNNFQLRESEVNMDFAGRDTLGQQIMGNLAWAHSSGMGDHFGRNESMVHRGESIIRAVNMGSFTLGGGGGSSGDGVKKGDGLDKETAELLYSAMAEYTLEHLQMRQYYRNRGTRERDIMKPFVIDQFFK